MTPKSRWRSLFGGAAADRLPCDYWATGEVTARLMRDLGVSETDESTPKNVIVEYGTRISSVASSVMNIVKFAVEKAVGVPVAQVNVHVQGLRISDTD